MLVVLMDRIRAADRGQRRAIEPLHRVEIARAQMHVIDQSPPMELHCCLLSREQKKRRPKAPFSLDCRIQATGSASSGASSKARVILPSSSMSMDTLPPLTSLPNSSS